jgi:hypothetical protein
MYYPRTGEVEMFLDALRVFQTNDGTNYLPMIPDYCRHKVDSIVLEDAGLSNRESKDLIRLIKGEGQQEFSLRTIKDLTPRLIKNVSGERISRSIIIWAMLERMINFHSDRCSRGQNTDLEYVEVDNMTTLEKDLPISQLGLSGRSLNALSREGINFVSQIKHLPKSQLFRMQNLGVRSVSEILEELEKVGVYLENEPISNVEEILSGDVSLEDLDFSVRTYNALKRIGVESLYQLSKMTVNELRDIRNFGEKCLSEVSEALERYESNVDDSTTDSIDSNSPKNEDMILWALNEFQIELAAVEEQVDKYGHLKIEHKEILEKSKVSIKKEKYFGCATLHEVYKKFNEEAETISDILQLKEYIFNLDSFMRDMLVYFKNYEDLLPTKTMKESLLKYENDFSNESVDLMRYDEFTLKLLGLPVNNISIFLGQDSYFDTLDKLSNYFFTDGNVWNLVVGVVRFHDKYATFPNLLGLVIAQYMSADGSQNDKERNLLDLYEIIKLHFSQRELEILRMRVLGSTLDEIGKEVGLTRERVRQILVKLSPDLDPVIEVLKKRNKRVNEINLDRKLESIIESHGAVYKSELAMALGISEELVVDSIPKKYLKFVIDRVPEQISVSTWSKEDCLVALRKAATFYFPIRQADYDHLLAIGEVDGPSIPYMYLKYGQWSDLCQEAGVECVPSLRPEYIRIWSEEELLNYAIRFFKEPQTTGSYGSYDLWREEQSDHVPSGVLIRNVFGSWTAVKRKVHEGLRKEKGLALRNDI